MKFGLLINHGQGGPGWVLNEVKAMPRGTTLTILYTIFDRKSCPFLYLLTTNGASFTCLV